MQPQNGGSSLRPEHLRVAAARRSPLSRTSPRTCAFVPPHRTCSLTLQFPILSGPPSRCSTATLFDGFQGLLSQTALGRSRCVSPGLADTFRLWSSTLPSSTRFSQNRRKSLGSARLCVSSPVCSWATLSSRSRRTFSRTRLDGVIL